MKGIICTIKKRSEEDAKMTLIFVADDKSQFDQIGRTGERVVITVIPLPLVDQVRLDFDADPEDAGESTDKLPTTTDGPMPEKPESVTAADDAFTQAIFDLDLNTPRFRNKTGRVVMLSYGNTPQIGDMIKIMAFEDGKGKRVKNAPDYADFAIAKIGIEEMAEKCGWEVEAENKAEERADALDKFRG